MKFRKIGKFNRHKYTVTRNEFSCYKYYAIIMNSRKWEIQIAQF